MKRLIAVFVILLSASWPLSAQEPQGQGQQGQGRQGQAAPPTPQGGQPRPGSTPPPTVSGPRGDDTSWQNVKIVLTVTDSNSSQKTVTLVVLDRRSGQIRTGTNRARLNVDAAPQVRPDGRIYLSLTLDYQGDESTPADGGPPQSPLASVNESLSLILVDGKPMIASQSADPRTDRKVTVEVTANVVK